MCPLDLWLQLINSPGTALVVFLGASLVREWLKFRIRMRKMEIKHQELIVEKLKLEQKLERDFYQRQYNR